MSFLNYFLILSIVVCMRCSQPTKPSEIEINKLNPNIIFILADDMGYGDPTCYNPESKIPTPNIDLVAENGIRLTDAYAHPWSVPSRYGLMTGKHPLNTQLNTWRERCLINNEQITIASLLQRNGYYTALIGKWHLGFDEFQWENISFNFQMKGGPVEHGFDYFFGIHASLDIQPYFYIENETFVKPPVNYIEANYSPGATRPVSGAFWREGYIAPGFIHKEVDPMFADKALEFIENHHRQNTDQPFFLFLSLASPHTPWLPTPEFHGKSMAGEYGDFTVQVDNTVGRILNILEILDLENETLLIFTSDNGPLWFKDDIAKFNHHSAGPLRGMKQDVWEGGHRIPFVAQWPGRIPANIVRNDIVSFDDMMATFAAIVEDDLPEQDKLNSYNILPVLLNKTIKKPIRNELLILPGYLRDNHAIRYGNWKYIEGSGEGRVSRVHVNDSLLIGKHIPGELYNLKEDISEQNNLYDQYPSIVEKLSEKLKENLQNFKNSK